MISEIARNHKDLSHTSFIQGQNSPFKVLIHDTKGTGTFGFNVYFVRLEDRIGRCYILVNNLKRTKNSDTRHEILVIENMII